MEAAEARTRYDAERLQADYAQRLAEAQARQREERSEEATAASACVYAMMNGAPFTGSLSQAQSRTSERLAQLRAWCIKAAGQLPWDTNINPNEAAGHDEESTHAGTAKGHSHDDGLDCKNIAHAWIPAAKQQGICLIDICGNTAAALEASLKAGWKVSKYVYVDNDTDAAKLAQATVSRFMLEYPNALTEDAMDTFDNVDIPMDINQWQANTVKRLMQGNQQKPWLVCCGWPCQDNSPGGRGLGAEGHRSTLIDRIIPLIRTAQSQAQCAYVLENTAIQHNWTDQSKWTALLQTYDRKLGAHVCADAVRFGSNAHRVRNYWTNIADGTALQRAVNNIEVPLPPLHQYFPPGTEFSRVERSDSSCFFPANRKSHPRCILPTFTSFVASRAYILVPSKVQEGKSKPGPGMVCNKSGNWREPNSAEKASVMGHNPDCFCGSSLPDNARLGIIGKAWDLHAIVGLFILAQELGEPTTPHAYNLSVHLTQVDTPYH